MRRYAKKMRNVALTIDVEQDVPPYLDTWRGMEEGLPALLDLLSKHGIRATFFVTGRAAEKFPDLVKTISREHEVGCHGYEHERFDKLDLQEQFRRIELATKALNRVAGQVLGFRAPNFRPSPQTFAVLKQMGYLYDASNACYRIGPDPRDHGLAEIQNTWPSSFLRLPLGFSTRVLCLCLAALPLTVLDFHVWEAIKVTGVRFDCRFATGETALHRLDRVLHYLLTKGARFMLLREVVMTRSSTPNFNKRERQIGIR
jgi:peptidoglycan/xylan/chitin deacetylase (PgdA/CDA1 family)